MSKRLQVLLEESDLRDLRRAARAEGLTVAAWVRRALSDARRRRPTGDVARKIDAVRRAVRHQGPVADIDEMLRDIEQGYLSRTRA